MHFNVSKTQVSSHEAKRACLASGTVFWSTILSLEFLSQLYFSNLTVTDWEERAVVQCFL